MTIKEYQNELLQILLDFDTFCTEHNLCYCLCGGSALGAVREKGFIPWDDDIDVFMPREDYEKLIQIHSKMKKQYRLIYRDNACVYHLADINYPVQVQSENITSGKGTEYYACIDLFPLDGVPANAILRYLRVKAICICRYLNKLRYVHASYAGNSVIRQLVIRFAEIIHTEKWFPGKAFANIALKLATKTKLSDSDWCMCAFGVYKLKDCYPKNWIFPFKRISFENHQIPILNNHDEYLRQLYGDYMTPKERASVHFRSYERKEE